MNASFLKSATIAGLAFCAGYIIYPVINLNKANSELLSVATKTATNDAKNGIVNHPNTEMKQEQVVSMQDESDVSDTRDEIIVDVSNSVSGQSSSPEVNARVDNRSMQQTNKPQFKAEQSSLEKWRLSHKSEVQIALEDRLPDDVKENFLTTMNKEDYFSHFDATQDSENNLQWS